MPATNEFRYRSFVQRIPARQLTQAIANLVTKPTGGELRYLALLQLVVLVL